jgi:stearoyl-CoA desaturase (delta-9 desaturase)
MSIFRASTKAISAIQLAVLATAVIGLFAANFTWQMVLLAFICFHFYSAAGISMMFHRYWTHKSFEFKSPVLKWFFTLVACLAAKGSPIAWVYVHRLHHAKADTPDDPHSPHYGGFRIMGFKSINLEMLRVFVVRDMLNKPHKLLNDYYLLLILAWAALLLLISPAAFYFAWILPVAVLQLAQDMFNYFAHTHGYRNFVTKDKSTNNFWLWPFILGEAWHNNHHHAPQNPVFGIKKWELDPVQHLINAVKQ